MKWLKKILIVVAGLVGFALAGLLAARMRSSAGVIDVSVEIAKPAAAIWPWLNEPDKIKQWVSWTKEIRPLDPGKDGVGARDLWIMEDRNNGNALMETEAVSTVYQPYTRMAARLSVKDAFQGDIAYELKESGGPNGVRTTIRSIGRFEYLHWFANLMEPLITPEARKKSESDFATLKRLAEAQ